MSESIRRSWRIATLVLATTSATACGPTIEVSVGVRQPPINRAYGGSLVELAHPPKALPPSVVFAPVGGTSFRLPEGGDDVGEVIRQQLTPERTRGNGPGTTPDDCPGLRSTTLPKEAATVEVLTPPKPGRYTYRRTGLLGAGNGIGDYDQVLARLDGYVTREVKNVTQSADPLGQPVITFDIVDVVGDLTTTTTWRTESTQPKGGMKIARVVLESPKYPRPFVFDIQPALRLMTLPVVPEGFYNGTSNREIAAAAEGSARLDFNHGHDTRERVPVCEEVVDTWRNVYAGNIATQSLPGFYYKFHSTGDYMKTDSAINVATQYGGLIVKQRTSLAWTDPYLAAPGRYLHLEIEDVLVSMVPQAAP